MKKIAIIASIFIIGCSFHENTNQNIFQWRGNNRDGIYNESQLLNKWPEKGPELLWSTEEIGSGYSSPVITSDKVFLNGETDKI